MRKKRSVPDEEGLFLLCCFIEETLDWPVSLKDFLRETELDWLQRALAACDQRQNEAAKLLGLSYDQMRALMRKHHQTTRPGRQKKKQT